MQPEPATASAPPKSQQLGFWMVLALVVGTFIGSGIFLLPAQLAPYGWNSVIGWIVTGAGAIGLSFIFAALARSLPFAAGPYAYVDEAFGRLPAFTVAWAYWVSIWVGNAAISIAAVSYLSLFFPALSSMEGAGALASIAILWALTLVNCLSVRAGGGVQVITTLLKLVPMLATVIIAALILASPEPTAMPSFDAADIKLTSVNAVGALTLWALLGFEAAAIASRNVRNPSRTVPLATVVGTLIVATLYLLTATPVTMFLPVDQVTSSNAPFALFISSYAGAAFGGIVAAFIAISVIGTLNGLILISGELPRAMSDDGSFPAVFAKLSARGIAVRAILLSSLLTSLLIASNYSRSLGGLFAFMALLATAGTLVLYFACALAALKLQRTGELPRSPIITIVACLAIPYTIWTLYGAGSEALIWGAALLAVGGLLYAVMRQLRGSTPRAEASPAAPAEPAA